MLDMTPTDVIKHYERLGIPVPEHIRAALGIAPTQSPTQSPTQYPTQQPTQRRRKYGNEPTEYGGRRYESRHEAGRASELDLMLSAGEILAWFPQVPIAIAGGRKYIADFVVLRSGGVYEIWDAKSPATKKNPVYRLKRDLVRERWAVEITEV